MAKISLQRTSLAQADYAKYMGINPVAFEGCYVTGFFEDVTGCDSVWPRFAWQSSANASREDLAIQIYDAERTIGELMLGYNVVPQWVELEMPYPNKTSGMRDRYGKFKTISLPQGNIIAGGRRATQFIGNFPVSYTDEDGDNFKERATIDLGNEYTWTEVKVYHAGMNADPSWEIRPIARVDTSLNKLIFDSWLFVDPELTSAFNVTTNFAINITDGTNFVETVDVYLEYNDNQYTPSVQFIWNRTSGGDATQDGYLEIVDGEAGVVRPVPAIFDYEAGCLVLDPTLCFWSDPDRIKINFYAGSVSQDYKAGLTLDPLDRIFAESIRLLATARLDRDLCGCTNTIAHGRNLREDMALVSPQGNFLAVADVIQECPLGTRRGEWLAWNRLKMHQDKFLYPALV